MRDGTHTPDGSRAEPSLLGALGFFAGFATLGWSAGHDLAYSIATPLDRDQLQSVHGYLDAAQLVGQLLALLGFAIALRLFLRTGSFGDWLRASSTTKLRTAAALTPVAAFLAMEFGERAIAGVAVVPELHLLVVGVLVQALVGLLVLAVARWTLRTAAAVVQSIVTRTQPRLAPNGAPSFVPSTSIADLASIAATMCPLRRGPPALV